nr:Crp/Fnr family transcriptional regulator [uncultured Niameybacter sp.]
MKNKPINLFFNRIPDSILPKCQIRHIEVGKVVVLKGNEIKNVYISCEGKMQVKNEFENGFIYSFSSIEPIAYIGVMEVMANKQTYSSTLQAMTKCTLLEIPKEDFLSWITRDQVLMLEVLHFVSSLMYEQSLKIGEVLAYPAICILIDYLINVFESVEDEAVFIQKTREEMSCILGFSVRTLNRNLKILKEEHLITVSRKGIAITKEQVDGLRKKLASLK